jgi:alanyl-tRNA synthetase
MKSQELRKKFINFFVENRHKELPSASVVPENDPSALFINSGMHPLVPYLMGEPHPLGKRLTSVQKCIRTVDIEEVGDTYHHTFFEMLGNWSLGAYFKEQAIKLSWEFLTDVLHLDPARLSVTVFAGSKNAHRDERAAEIWQSLGVPEEKIYYLGEKDNWWSVGKVGPCGPDTEVFYDTQPENDGCSSECRPGCNCGKYFEIWNNVFMVYQKTEAGKLKELPQKNVDTGLGLERTVAVLNGLDDNYKTDLFKPLIEQISAISGKEYQEGNKKEIRVIADHLRAATFICSDGVYPSNKGRGYILRRLIRRAIRFGSLIGIAQDFSQQIVNAVIRKYKVQYPELAEKSTEIKEIISEEEKKFSRVLQKGLSELEDRIKELSGKVFPGKQAFNLYQTYGFPVEMTEEILKEKGLKLEKEAFIKAKEKHQQKSKKQSGKRFSGGLANKDPKVVNLHTATHLLHQALKKVLGEEVKQAGSNITKERLRFDFTFPRGMKEEEIKGVEELVNRKIKENLPVTYKTMDLDKALKSGAAAHFKTKYPDRVKVYYIGSEEKGNVFSKELCGGPHVDFTGELGEFRINKEESCGAGKRRIYAVLQ